MGLSPFPQCHVSSNASIGLGSRDRSAGRGDQVYALVADFLAQHVKVVAIVERLATGAPFGSAEAEGYKRRREYNGDGTASMSTAAREPLAEVSDEERRIMERLLRMRPSMAHSRAEADRRAS